MVPYGVDSSDSALQQGRIDDTRSSLARGRSGSRRVGRFVRFGDVLVSGSLVGVWESQGRSVRAFRRCFGRRFARGGLEVAGSIGSCVSAMFRSQVRSGGLVGVWRIATSVWVCSGVVGIVWYELGSL